VYGRSSNGQGVYGTSSSSNGVEGRSTAVGGSGVAGIQSGTSSNSGDGLYGESADTTNVYQALELSKRLLSTVLPAGRSFTMMEETFSPSIVRFSWQPQKLQGRALNVAAGSQPKSAGSLN
jgi:hypothetical protein